MSKVIPFAARAEAQRMVEELCGGACLFFQLPDDSLDSDHSTLRCGDICVVSPGQFWQGDLHLVRTADGDESFRYVRRYKAQGREYALLHCGDKQRGVRLPGKLVTILGRVVRVFCRESAELLGAVSPQPFFTLPETSPRLEERFDEQRVLSQLVSKRYEQFLLSRWPKIQLGDDQVAIVTAQYRHAVDWRTDERGKILAITQNWEELTGMAFTALLKSGWISALHPDEREQAAHVWQRCLTTGDFYSVRYSMRTGSGDYRPVIVEGYSCLTETGSVEWYGSNHFIQDLGGI